MLSSIITLLFLESHTRLADSLKTHAKILDDFFVGERSDRIARPAMSTNITTKHLTKSEKDAKLSVESKLKGSSGKLRPPLHLSTEQKKIFKFIVNALKNSDILSNMDVYVLSECSICIDRMKAIESKINANPELLENSSLMATKDRYTKAFFRYCNELCLSPQARAKIANINLQTEDKNPLMELLSE